MTLRGDRVTASKLGTQRNACAPTQKKCGVCGEIFSCGAPEPGCWCEGMELTSESAARLRARHSDCLCPHCLAAAAGRSMKLS
jgi:Cysteine-rich CWC